MWNTRAGFSLIEGILALAIGLVLLSITARAMAPVREASALRSGDQVVRSMLSRTRAEAIQRGETVRLRFDPTGDTAWIQASAGQLDRFDFDDELGVDLRASHSVTVCMTPNGVADANCSFPSIALIGLSTGTSHRFVTMLPSGQVISP